MKITDITNLRSKLDSGQVIHMTNQDGATVTLLKRKSLARRMEYFFFMNAKLLFNYQSFSIFKAKAHKKVQQHHLYIPEWGEVPFMDYYEAVEHLLESQYGITVDDCSSMDNLAAAQELGESPEQVVNWWSEKYDLTKIKLS